MHHRLSEARIRAEVSANLGLTVRGNSLILTVSEKESDIYVMELEY